MRANSRKGIPNIPKGDLLLIVELAKTLSVHEIAKKWEVGARSIGRYLERHGYTIEGIKRKHRLDFISSNPAMTTEELATGAGCKESEALRLMKLIELTGN